MRIIRRFVVHCFLALFSLLLSVSIALALIYVYIEWQLPDVSVLKEAPLQAPLRIYTSDKKLIAQYGAIRSTPVTLDKIPKQLIQAVLATEDARFYSHPGVDIIGLGRAALAVAQSGRKVQGASTITMQVARNFFLTHKKTYGRKLREILLALKIEREFSKDKILELYLNRVYFGYRAYGVAAAAQVYYGKPMNELTLAELAALAGLPQSPSRDNPIDNPAGALDRRNHVLKRMLDVGFIDKASYQKAIKEPLTATYHGPRVEFRAPYIAEMVRQVLFVEYGQAAYNQGLNVYTTISSQFQTDADRALRDGLIAYSERHDFFKPSTNWGLPDNNKRVVWTIRLKKLPNFDPLQPAVTWSVENQSINVLLANNSIVTIPWEGLAWARQSYKKRAQGIVRPGDVIYVRQNTDGSWALSQIPRVQGAIVVLNPQNGAVLALDGGFNYSLSKFNRATQADRQPGSNFKPFIYSAALDKGFTLASVVNDAPVVIRDLASENGVWRPHNDNMKFYGPTRLRVALTQSRNLVSVRLLQSIGVSYVLNYVSRFGFDPKKLPHVLSLALGSGSVTPMQIAVGYSTFANGGYRVVPYFIQEVLNQNHKVIYEAIPAHACETCISNPNSADARQKSIAPQVLSPQNAYLITSSLQDVIRSDKGTAHAANVLQRSDLAGKTGTSNNKVDAWFSGFNSDIEATVWVGFDNDRISLHEFGAQAALPIWMQFMQSVLKDTPMHSMPKPPGIVSLRIDPHTGMLARPSQRNAIYEVFREKDAPKGDSYATNSWDNSAIPGTSGSPLNDTSTDTDTGNSESDGGSNNSDPLF
jgi:penicillin-binding protein 1A